MLQYDEALRLFARARDQIAINDPVSAVTIAQKMEEYSARAKVLRDALAQNPFYSPAPAGQMAAPMAGGSPQVYHAPLAPMPAYVAMPQPTYNNPPAPQQPAVMNQLPVMAPPPAAQQPPNPNANKIIKTKEQGFVGHANKIKLVVGLPRYAERLYVSSEANAAPLTSSPPLTPLGTVIRYSPFYFPPPPRTLTRPLDAPPRWLTSMVSSTTPLAVWSPP